MGPETSMEVQAALGSDIALAFDECTPFHVDRDYTARSTERTHRWLDRCIDWQPRTRRTASCSSGSSRAACTRTCASQSAERVGDLATSTASRSAARSGRRRRRCTRWWGGRLRPVRDEQPRHLLGIGDVDDIIRGVAAGIDSFDCATPTRLARHGTALVPDPSAALAPRSPAPRLPRQPRADRRGLPVPSLPRPHPRLPPLPGRAGELTAARLITLHNLTFVALLMKGIREAIVNGELDAYAARALAGDEPY